MPCSLEAATVNLDFLSVRIFCTTFARTDCQEKFLVQYLDIQSCDSFAAVWYVGTKRPSHLKSRYFIHSKDKSGISDFRVLSKKSATALILLHLRRACSMSSTSPAVHCTLYTYGGGGVWHVHSMEPILGLKYTVQHLPQKRTHLRSKTWYTDC